MPCSTTSGAGRSSPFLASGLTRNRQHQSLLQVDAIDLPATQPSTDIDTKLTPEGSKKQKAAGSSGPQRLNPGRQAALSEQSPYSQTKSTWPQSEVLEILGAPGWDRTSNPCLRSAISDCDGH